MGFYFVWHLDILIHVCQLSMVYMYVTQTVYRFSLPCQEVSWRKWGLWSTLKSPVVKVWMKTGRSMFRPPRVMVGVYNLSDCLECFNNRNTNVKVSFLYLVLVCLPLFVSTSDPHNVCSSKTVGIPELEGPIVTHCYSSHNSLCLRAESKRTSTWCMTGTRNGKIRRWGEPPITIITIRGLVTTQSL